MPQQIWRFADCEFDEDRYELRVGGVPVDVEVKPLQVLRALLRHSGEVVTKDELLDAVWSNTSVVDGSLATAISKLRKALGPHGNAIVTLPRVGYRIGVDVVRRAGAAPAWQALALEAGQQVPGRPQWRLVRRLDVSPSSDVWLAEHPKTDERRVFKFAQAPAQLSGLKREVTVARLLGQALGGSAAFVRVLEWNVESFPFFVESEYCGPSLVEWAAAQGGLSAVPLATRLRIVERVAAALHAAHQTGVLHKDLKPANLLVDEHDAASPSIKIADFGSAAMIDPDRLSALDITTMGFTEPAAGSHGGTLAYVAPEVLAGHAPSPLSDVFSLGVLLYQMVVADFRRLPAPGWEADVAEARLRDAIAAAANGDPSRRIQSAGELAERLRSLDDSRTAPPEAAPSPPLRRVSRGTITAVIAVAAAAMIAIALAGQRGGNTTPALRPLASVAIMPFDNAGGDPSLDYLRIALADEAATILSHANGILVRPLMTAGQLPPGGSAAARVPGVDHVLNGRFIGGGGRLTISLELVRADSQRLVWRDSLDAPLDQLAAARVQTALRLRGGLLRALGGSPIDAGPEPASTEAYQLYLQSISLGTDPAANGAAILMLQRALALDGQYAPAWHALSKRHYIDARYGDGAESDIARADDAAERAAALDPEFVAPAAGLVVSAVERGDVAGALHRALPLVARRPDSVDAHFALSYAYRFAGRLDEAAAHCEEALLLDPRNITSGLRSCAFVFLLRGDYPRAINYLHLDQGSQWEKALTIHMLIRQGKTRDGLQLGSPIMPHWQNFDLLRACASGRNASEIAALAAGVVPSSDPETNYLFASHLSYCGETARAGELLARAIGGGYCSFPALETDPFFEPLRRSPGYTVIRSQARGCYDRLGPVVQGHG